MGLDDRPDRPDMTGQTTFHREPSTGQTGHIPIKGYVCPGLSGLRVLFLKAAPVRLMAQGQKTPQHAFILAMVSIGCAACAGRAPQAAASAQRRRPPHSCAS
jgi:hypothetical protein